MRALEFVVPGRPVPKARMTAKGKYTPRAQRTLAYQQKVAIYAKMAGQPLGSIDVVGFFAVYVCGGNVGDLDNYIKAIKDGVQLAGLVDNDRQINEYDAGTAVYKVGSKAEERVEVRLRPREDVADVQAKS